MYEIQMAQTPVKLAQFHVFVNTLRMYMDCLTHKTFTHQDILVFIIPQTNCDSHRNTELILYRRLIDRVFLLKG